MVYFIHFITTYFETHTVTRHTSPPPPPSQLTMVIIILPNESISFLMNRKLNARQRNVYDFRFHIKILQCNSNKLVNDIYLARAMRALQIRIIQTNET